MHKIELKASFNANFHALSVKQSIDQSIIKFIAGASLKMNQERGLSLCTYSLRTACIATLLMGCIGRPATVAMIDESSFPMPCLVNS